MKITTITLALASILLASCKTTTLEANIVIPAREDTHPSWGKFCEARHYDINTTDSEIINEYLDTWCGSAEEEQALNL